MGRQAATRLGFGKTQPVPLPRMDKVSSGEQVVFNVSCVARKTADAGTALNIVMTSMSDHKCRRQILWRIKR